MRNPGPVSRLAGRLGSKVTRYSDTAGGQRIEMDFSLQDVTSDEAAAIGGRRLATGVNWGWSDGPPGVPPWQVRRSDLSPRQTKAVFDETARRVADEIRNRPPQVYTFSGLTGGHNRRYSRDLEAMLEGSGYEMVRVGEQVFLKPTAQAYIAYATRQAPLAASAAGAASAPLWQGDSGG